MCWDKQLIPKNIFTPYTYPKSELNKQKTKVTQIDLIDYFVNFDRTIVGKINNRYVDFANISEKGVLCP